MKKRLLILLMSLFTLLNAAGVEAVLSQKEVVQGNPVQLKLIAKGDRAEFPQITQIDGVPVEGHSQTQHTSLQIINGKSTVAHTTELILTLTPTKDMHIPSYEVKIDGKSYKTEPLELKVTKSTAPKDINSAPLALVMKADKHEVIVGEPLVVTVYFSVRNDVRLADNPQYNRPSFKGFFVKEVDEERSYMKGDHRITELRYILVPQKAGHYVLDPATAKVPLVDRSRRDMFGRFFGSTWRSLRSNTFDITVDPAPQDTDLVGRFYIESKIDKTTTKENKPVNLTVTIEGDGSLEDYEMPNYEIDGVTVYSDDAEVTTRVIGDKLKSTYVKKFAFISDHDFDIPSRTLSTYDPQTKEVKQLEIPGYHVQVAQKKHAGTSSVASPPANEEHRAEVQTDIKLPESTEANTPVAQKEQRASVAWWMVLLAFLAGMVSMYLLGKFKWKRPVSPFKEDEALKILYGHMSDDPKVEEMVRKLYAKKHGQKDVIIDKKELKALVEKYAGQHR